MNDFGAHFKQKLGVVDETDLSTSTHGRKSKASIRDIKH